MMTVVDLIVRNARRTPGSVAFVEARPVSKVRKEVTWETFNERMNRIGQVLVSKDVRKGGKVALFGRNSIS